MAILLTTVCIIVLLGLIYLVTANKMEHERINVRGKKFEEHRKRIRALRLENKTEEMEKHLKLLLDLTEKQARADNWGVVPWYFFELARFYRDEHRREDEYAVLQRLSRQPILPDRTKKRLKITILEMQREQALERRASQKVFELDGPGQK